MDRFYLKAARANKNVEKTAKYLALLTLMGHQQLCFWPSTVASALVILASQASCNLVAGVGSFFFFLQISLKLFLWILFQWSALNLWGYVDLRWKWVCVILIMQINARLKDKDLSECIKVLMVHSSHTLFLVQNFFLLNRKLVLPPSHKTFHTFFFCPSHYKFHS